MTSISVWFSSPHLSLYMGLQSLVQIIRTSEVDKHIWLLHQVEISNQPPFCHPWQENYRNRNPSLRWEIKWLQLMQYLHQVHTLHTYLSLLFGFYHLFPPSKGCTYHKSDNLVNGLFDCHYYNLVDHDATLFRERESNWAHFVYACRSWERGKKMPDGVGKARNQWGVTSQKVEYALPLFCLSSSQRRKRGSRKRSETNTFKGLQ